MNVVHYTLGIPPLRSGGLTKYSIDLVKEEKKQGVNVALLYAGGINLLRRGKYFSYKKKWNAINRIELINTMPIPLLDGVLSPSHFMSLKKEMTEEVMNSFISNIKPDIFHIHTLMGLPLELVLFLKKKGVKIIFTSHDYFGLCLRVNFIDNYGQLCNGPSPQKCSRCNNNAKSTLFLRLRNSKIFLFSKKLLVKGEKILKTNISVPIIDAMELDSKREDYSNLLLYYMRILGAVDHFHFNSTVARDIYIKNIDVRFSDVLSICHSNIRDNRIKRIFDDKNLKLTFIGSFEPYKGFDLLKRCLLELNENGNGNWRLNVFGNNNRGMDKDCTNIIYHGKYKISEISSIFHNTDLLIIPSICHETFGLVALEALSYGTPVLVSDSVGAKDLIKDYDKKFIFKTRKDLVNILGEVINNRDILREYSGRIMSLPWNHCLENHAQGILSMYKNV